MADIMIDLKIEALEEGGYLALSDDLPGLLAEGRSYQETIEIAQDVARRLIESYIEHKDKLPEKILRQINIKHKTTRFKIPVAIAL
jgi:antitoxin HicB